MRRSTPSSSRRSRSSRRKWRDPNLPTKTA
jgi:hypothetical protein